MLVLFFFQAEDGIRDIGVTGVQTCALPISTCLEKRRICSSLWGAIPSRRLIGDRRPRANRTSQTGVASSTWPSRSRRTVAGPKIGRASCRERVEISVGAVSFKKKRKQRERG